MSATTLTTPLQSHSSIDDITPNDASPDKTRHLIDQELLRLEDSIRALRSRRNVLAPISRLPPEILSKIFADCVAECTGRIDPLEWIRVTHVSRHWRTVAFDCPGLWGNLVFTRPKWLEEMLKRSKMAGLVVKADLSCFTPRIFETVRLALLHAPRIRDLQLRASSANFRRLLTTKPSLQVPMIGSLSLSVPFDEDFTLPDTVLTGETPHLRRLELHRINFNWNSRFLRDLTRLSIHGVATHARPTMDQLMNALERMPALEVFDIQDALPLISHGLSTDRIVDLPHLTLLSVTSTVPECANLVSLLTIPADARVQLSCRGTETTGADFSGVMRVITNPRGTTYSQEEDSLPGRESIQVLHIRYEDPISLVILGWTSAITPDPWINVPDIQLRFSWHQSPLTTVDSVIASVCRAIPITPLHSLRVAYVDVSPKIWIDTFGLLLKLDNVHIVGRPAHAFVSALHEEAPIEAVTSPLLTPEGFSEVKPPGLCQRRPAVPSVYFPQLRSLTMEEVSFDEEDTSQTTLTLRDLEGCLVERSERQAEIQKLCLRECSHLCADTVQALRAFVTVDWDGIEQMYPKGSEDEYDEMGGYFDGYDVYGYSEDLDLDTDFSIFSTLNI